MGLPNQLPAGITVSPALTAIAIVYKNPTLIADEAIPRVKVETPDFKYTVRNKTDNFSVSDSLVGRKGYVNEVTFSENQATGSVEDHFLDGPIPRRDALVAASYGRAVTLDPRARMTEKVTNDLALGREARAAATIMSPSSYAAGNTTTLSGSSQWSYSTSDPLGSINTVFDSLLVRPNVGVVGRAVLSQLLRNPQVVQAFHGNQGAIGAATAEFIREQLGLEKLLIGESFINISKPGQNANLQRVWGKNAAFYYQEPVQVDTETMSMFITAEWGDRVTSEYYDPKRGGRGSDIVRVGEAVKELALAPDLGYLFQAAVA